MAETRWEIAPLSSRLDRSAFSCGIAALDRYLRELASKDVKRKFAACFVGLDPVSGTIAGFYTLSMASVRIDDVPPALRKSMPRYPTVPAVRLGRLAVDSAQRGRGLGRHLLVDAMTRSVANEVAWAVFLVDAKDEAARSFYGQYGFASFADDPNHLYLHRQTLERALRSTAAGTGT